MFQSVAGTRDFPIVVDEDSEDEVVAETYDPLRRALSPRPYTFLSAMPVLSEASARTLQQFREGLQQQVRTGKRKREQDLNTINNLQHGKHKAEDSSALCSPIGRSPTGQESRKQRKLRRKLEREANPREGMGLAKGKQKATPNSLPITEQRNYHQIPCPQTSVSTSTHSQEIRQTKRIKHANRVQSGPPATAPSLISTSIAPTRVPSDASSAAPPVTVKPLLPPKPPPRMALGPAGESVQSGSRFEYSAFPSFPQASGSCGMTPDMRLPETIFDPLLPSSYMFMSGLPMPSMPLPLPPSPIVHQPASHLKPLLRKSLMPSSAKPNALPDKKAKRQPNPERPFTLRQIERQLPTSTSPTNPTPLYVPIGKPDFRSNHGIFPILPSVMLPKSDPASTSARSHKSYIPVLGNTLVMENIPANLCNDLWISNWSHSTCGVIPIKILLGPMRALLEYPSSEIAIAAWASPKLGVDEFGRRKIESGRLKEFPITVYWWRPDTEGEKKLLQMWRMLKKQISAELRKAVDDKFRQLEVIGVNGGAGGSGDGKEFKVNIATATAYGTSNTIQLVQQAKDEFIDMARQLEFERRMMVLINAGADEDEICRWEQREVARIERRLRAMNRQQPMAEEKVLRRKDDVVLKRKALIARKKAEVAEEKRKKSKGTKGEKKRPTEGERNITNAGTPPRPHIQATVERWGKFQSAFPPPVPNIPSSASVSTTSTPTSTSTSTTTSTTTFAAVPDPTYPSPFSLTFSINSNTSHTPSNTGNSQLFFGLDKARTTVDSSFHSSISSAPVSATAVALSTPASVLAPSPALPTKAPLSEKPSPHSTLPTSLPAALPSPHRTNPSTVLFPLLQTGSSFALSQPSNPHKRKLTDTESTMTNQEPATKKLCGIGPAKGSQTWAQVPVLSVSGMSTYPDKPPERLAVPIATTTAPTATSSTVMVASASPRRIAEGRLVEGLRKLGQEPTAQRPPSITGAPASASGLDTSAATSPIMASAETKITELSTTRTGQKTLGITCRLVVPSLTVSRQSASGASVSIVAPNQVSPVDMDISPTSEEDKPIKLGTSTITVTRQASTIQQQDHLRTPTSIPKLTRSVPPAVLEALKTIMAKPVEERQQFLDGEFKMTKALMANLATATKDRKKRIMKLWEEKIRIIDEVTKSIKNENRVWYSYEIKAWIRMRWPNGLEDAEALVINDDED